MKKQPSLVECKDGSHTLFSSQYNQHYHNPNGAVKESLHIFFKVNGLQDALQKGHDFSVLEVGFGTGLNLMLLADMHESINSSSKVKFYSIESNLIAPETAAKLNYASFLKHPYLIKSLPGFFEASPGINTFTVTEDIELNLYNGLFEDFQMDSLKADFILHDAFSPGVNAELWSTEAFAKLRAHSSEKVTLSTYSSAVRARDAMARAGWLPTRVPGILGKREMTVAGVSF
ncbi:MAG: tRNA (5-methylaminomethyl-2-thiouridine)(34)-methyltransferase MnmD [Balneolales bacterium]